MLGVVYPCSVIHCFFLLWLMLRISLSVCSICSWFILVPLVFLGFSIFLLGFVVVPPFWGERVSRSCECACRSFRRW